MGRGLAKRVRRYLPCFCWWLAPTLGRGAAGILPSFIAAESFFLCVCVRTWAESRGWKCLRRAPTSSCVLFSFLKPVEKKKEIPRALIIDLLEPIAISSCSSQASVYRLKVNGPPLCVATTSASRGPKKLFDFLSLSIGWFVAGIKRPVNENQIFRRRRLLFLETDDFP